MFTDLSCEIGVKKLFHGSAFGRRKNFPGGRQNKLHLASSGVHLTQSNTNPHAPHLKSIKRDQPTNVVWLLV
jgi:hypothetical protein